MCAIDKLIPQPWRGETARHTPIGMRRAVLILIATTSSLWADANLWLPLEERIKRADVVAVVVINRVTVSNAHAVVEQVLKGKAPREITLTIRADTANACASYTLSEGRRLTFLNGNGDRLQMSNLTPPIGMEEGRNDPLGGGNAQPMTTSNRLAKVQEIIARQAAGCVPAPRRR